MLGCGSCVKTLTWWRLGVGRWLRSKDFDVVEAIEVCRWILSKDFDLVEGTPE